MTFVNALFWEQPVLVYYIQDIILFDDVHLIVITIILQCITQQIVAVVECTTVADNSITQCWYI